MNKKDIKVCIIGLGYVGLTLAVTLAKKGILVYGVETDNNIIKKLKKNKVHFFEPNIEKYIQSVFKNKKFFTSNKIQKNNYDYFIITVGTPLNSLNKINIENIKKATKSISSYLSNDSTVILRSTVSIGTTENIVMPLLDKSNKKYNIAFCPERTMEGVAMKELTKLPQIIGSLDNKSFQKSKKLFSILTKKIIRVNSIKAAEMIKLVDNSQRDLYFAFSNEVSMACDAMGINSHEVIKKGKINYPRTNLYKPGPVGGPCLEKDPYILSNVSQSYGYEMKIIKSGRKTNIQLFEHMIKYVSSYYKNLKLIPEKISIIGTAFKGHPETDDLRGTTLIMLLNSLIKHFPKKSINCFDFIAKEKTNIFLKENFSKNNNIFNANKIENIFKNADLVIIHNNNKKIYNLDFNNLLKYSKKNLLIYDFWNMFDQSFFNKINRNITYKCLGGHVE